MTMQELVAQFNEEQSATYRDMLYRVEIAALKARLATLVADTAEAAVRRERANRELGELQEVDD